MILSNFIPLILIYSDDFDDDFDNDDDFMDFDDDKG